MSMIAPRMTVVGALLALVLLAPAAPCAGASGVPTAGSGDELWLMVPGEKGMTLYHRSITDPAGQVTPVSELTGKLMGPGLAAAGDRLWLVFEKGTVQSLSLRRKVRPGEGRYGDRRTEAGLPPSSLVSMAATDEAPWALVRVESADALAQIDAATQPSIQLMDRAARQARRGQGSQTIPASRPGDAVARPVGPASGPSSAPATAPAAINALRLLKLEKNQWIRIPLPEDLPADAKAWLVTLKSSDAAPALLHWREMEEGPGELTWYRRGAEGWSSRGLPLSSAPPFVPVAVDGQLLLARVGPSESGLRVSLSVATEAGEIDLGAALWLAEASQAWGVAPAGQTAAVVRAEPERKLAMGTITLRGDVTPMTPLAPPARELFRESTGRIAQMVLLGAGVVVMFVVMRREPSAPRPKMPEGMAPADLFRRSLAAGADMVPGVLLAMLQFRAGPDEIFAAWPMASAYMLTMPPTLVALGVMVVHCSISEALTGRSLGKYLMGLRLMSTTDQPIRLWQILVRNLLKPVELISWVMLFLPVILPLAQRFGDVLSRTLVLGPEPEDGEEDEE